MRRAAGGLLAGWPLLVAAALLGVGMLPAARPASAKPLSDIQRILLQVKPAVVYVQVQVRGQVAYQGDGGRLTVSDAVGYTATGSGFLVNPDGYLITNGHVVADLQASADDLQSRLVQQFFLTDLLPKLVQSKVAGSGVDARFVGAAVDKAQLFSLWLGKAKPRIINFGRSLVVATSNRKIYPAEIKKYSPSIAQGGKDVAVLKIEGRNFPTLLLGDSDRAGLQEEVFPVGFPGVATNHPFLSDKTMLEATITSGHISALKQDLRGTPVIQIDAAITHGNSGGPTINRLGEVVGISTFGSVDQSGQEIGGFNFLVPVNTAKEFLRETGAENQRGLFDQLWAESIELYHDNKHKRVLAKLDEVMRFQPDLPDARHLQEEAQAEVTRHPVAAFFESTAIRVAVVVLPLLLLAALAVVLLKLGLDRRKRQTAPAAPGSSQLAPPPAVAARGARAGGAGGALPGRAAARGAGASGAIEGGARARGAGASRAAASGAAQMVGVVGGGAPAVDAPETLPSEVAPTMYARRLSLEFESGPEPFPPIVVVANTVHIGRDPAQAQVVLGDPSISRLHLRVEPAPGGGYVVVRLVERNPMLVNGKDVPRWNLEDGDRVQVGGTVMRARLTS